jgi:aminopeptidase 2
MFSAAGLSDDPEYSHDNTADNRIVKAAQNMFAKWAKGDKGAIFPDLRGAVFAIAIKHGGKEEVIAIKMS